MRGTRGGEENNPREQGWQSQCRTQQWRKRCIWSDLLKCYTKGRRMCERSGGYRLSVWFMSLYGGQIGCLTQARENNVVSFCIYRHVRGTHLAGSAVMRLWLKSRTSSFLASHSQSGNDSMQFLQRGWWWWWWWIICGLQTELPKMEYNALQTEELFLYYIIAELQIQSNWGHGGAVLYSNILYTSFKIIHCVTFIMPLMYNL